MKVNDIQRQFIIIRDNPELAYLDNAATTQTVDRVGEAVYKYYTEYRANIHRGLYKFSDEATQGYEESRARVANFIGAEKNEIVFTSGATHGLNILAHGLCAEFGSGDNVVLTEMEHHANTVPWQAMAQKYGFEIRYIPVVDYKLDLEVAEKLIDTNTKVVSFVAISNTLGTINPIQKIVELSKKVNANSIVDFAQGIAHTPVDVKKLDCDFLVFSGHKMYGPTGIGILYGKHDQLQKLEPLFYGGGMIKEVTTEFATYADAPTKFEGGTPNIAGAIGMEAAVDFLEDMGWVSIVSHREEVTSYLIAELSKHARVVGLGDTAERIGVVSFNIDGVHPHDVADILDKHNVAVRAGHHCTMPLMKKIGEVGTVRASVGIYTTKEDVDQLIEAIEKVKEVFKS